MQDSVPLVYTRRDDVTEGHNPNTPAFSVDERPDLGLTAPLLALEPVAGEFQRPAVLSHGAQELV